MNDRSDRAVAIVGVGAILPDAMNAAQFWENILSKRYSIREVPEDRWNAGDYYDPDPSAPDKTYSKIGGWVQGFDFDWKKYRIPPKVAAAMDESQKWAVEITAQALEDYSYPTRPLDLERTAAVLGTAMGGEMHYLTFLRLSFPEYARALQSVTAFNQLPPDVRQAILQGWQRRIGETLPPVTEDSMPGELPNIVSGRVANVFNLRGPNFITDAACAASLAALKAAVDMLAEHQVDAVLTGGVDHNMGVSSFIKFCKIGALSATGTRPFGKGADGFVMGEGAASFLLKRLEDAERDGDRIYAVIRGVGGASDGKGKGIYAPNPIGPQHAMRRAWEDAGLDPATASLIEAHGTSTRVGDIVEAESLTCVFSSAPQGSIALGSVKSNIGHLKAGAGAAGLLKAALAVHHKILPPTLNAEVPNPGIDFEHAPFYLIHEAREWTRANGTPRRCGVSSYGFGGTNFHVVLEEHIPGALTRDRRTYAGASVKDRDPGPEIRFFAEGRSQAAKPPVRGILALGAATPAELVDLIATAVREVEQSGAPPRQAPCPADLSAPERLVIDYGTPEELLDRLQKAQRAMSFDNQQAWKALQTQGIFRGSGPKPGKVAFLFPGQGSQYLNMGRQLMEIEPVVAQVFRDGDRVMTPILGQPLSAYIFLDSQDPDAVRKAEFGLMQTEITQPAVLTMDIALYQLLGEYGFKPDMVMGHSLGEYAALIAAGVMPFDDALEAVAARGREMASFHSVEDNGWMAAVMAPYQVIQETLDEIDGYVVAANINSYNQSVIGGASKAVEQAIGVFQKKGFEARRIPVSHAFHTRIVAPASKPLRQVLDRLHIYPPRLPVVANVSGGFYPETVEAIKDVLEQQVASPVQWIQGLEMLYEAGVRTFVEVGPKKALKGFVDDVLGGKHEVVSLFTNHPKTGELPTFNHALCGLYAAGYGAESGETIMEISSQPEQAARGSQAPVPGRNGGQAGEQSGIDAIGQMLAEALKQAVQQHGPAGQRQPYDRNQVPLGSVVITGTGLGLPGAEKAVMDPENALRILRGEQFIDLIPERFKQKVLDKRITRLVKSEDGSGRFEVIEDPNEVVRLAGRPGTFDITEEYGVPAKLVEALDITTQLAMAAGLDALREAGIPLVQTYRPTTTGKYLPERWMLPEALRDETGVIFASAFPGGDRMADEFRRYYTYQNRLDQLRLLEELRSSTEDPVLLDDLMRRIHTLRDALEREPYEFDRRFLLRILSMGHSQFAEYIGARGPNTQVNAACASTPQAIALAEDWIRTGRCRRVIVIAGDNVTSDNLMEWIGAGFLSIGAMATDDSVEEAALPFDKRRHGTLIGMGACALVLESEDAVRERGMRGIVELLSSETNNSAFHATRLDVNHIAEIMDHLMTSAERRFGIHRHAIAPYTVFVSHETFTPARGGSASAEVVALRKTFGEAANEIIISNTKGFTGHAMGVGIEDVIAVKILEHGIVPPVPNHKEIDPELGPLNLSRGGRYPVQYALHLAAGFGSQIAMVLIRRIPGGLDRIENQLQYQHWLARVSGYDWPKTEVVKRVLRIAAQGAPPHPPAPSTWRPGTGPTLRAAIPGNGIPEVGKTRPAAIPQGSVVREQFSAAGETAVVETKDEGPGTKEATEGDGTQPAETTIVEEPKMEEAKDDGRETKEVSQQVPAQPSSFDPVRPSPDSIAEKVLQIVAEKTGYPQDMLELDLDLEADLGIDTVKQAETFLAIRETFDIPRRDDLKLRDYPTLASVIQFVKEMRPDLTEATKDEGRKTEEEVQQDLTPASTATASPLSVQTVRPSMAVDVVAEKVLGIVAEKTGYPQEMLELDLDLEADLGIDTVKQAETFLAIRETFDIPRRDDLRLRDYPTLASVIQFVKEMRPDLTEATKDEGRKMEEEVHQAADEPPSSVVHLSSDPVTESVLAIISEKTGYPQEMLELDLDLEADLGIDTVKQAETFMAIRETFNIPRREDLKLRDYPTLAHVVRFVKEMRPDLAKATKDEGPKTEETKDEGRKTMEEVQQESAQPSSSVPSLHSGQALRPSSLDAADRIPRRVPVPVLRPPSGLCKPTGASLGSESRVVVMQDRGGVGRALVSRLEKRGVKVLLLPEAPQAEALEAQLAAWLQEGPIEGVYWLPALDVEPPLEEIDLETWRELNRQRVKNLYRTMRCLYEAVSGPGTFLVSATRLGGLHGYEPGPGAAAPLGGAVSGFTKAYKRERGQALVKVVDFEVSRKTAELAEALIAETLSDPGVVEVGYFQGDRFAIGLAEQTTEDGSPGMALNPESVFVVTGAAGGITSAIIADLAEASAGTFYLLDIVPAPDPADEHIHLFRQDREALKQKLIDEARASGERPTPARIEKLIQAVEREDAALRAIETVQSAGGQAFYYSVNLLDGPAVAAVVDQVRHSFGRIDVLIHAAGLEISRSLPDKDPQQFDLVFDVKADGFFNLLRAARGIPIGATVAFSSVAGRFGNAGQADYSAANDLLCKITSSLRTWRPETRAIAIDWTAWAGIGMATRGSIPKIMEMAGIEMLPPEAGIPTIRGELTRGGRRGEIVVGGRLGILTEEWDEAGGLDPEKAGEWLAGRKPHLLMTGQLKAAKLYGGLEVETTLDPRVQPFLHDHAMDGTPLLPGVMGTEAFAELASLLAGGYRVASVEDESFERAFKFFQMEPQTLYLNAVIRLVKEGELLAQATLKSRRWLPSKDGESIQEKVHFSANVRLTRAPLEAPKTVLTPAPGDWFTVNAKDIYGIYFHGPAYQVLENVQVSGEQAIGLLAASLPPNSQPEEAASLVGPRLIELCLQTAGVWEIKNQGVMALPTSIGSVTLHTALERAGSEPAARLLAIVQAVNGGESFDAQVVDEDGEVYITLTGYRTVKLPVAVSF